MKTKCIIVDDEPLAIEVIESHLSQFENIDIIGKCRHALEAFEILKHNHIDLMFLDIQMPHITGIDFIKNLANPPKIIITTAYRQYAVEGFDLDVVDYLLKPISFQRFLKAMNKYFEQIALSKPIISSRESSEAFIFVKADKKNYKIQFSDILFVESQKDYIIIWTKSKKIIAKIPISQFENQLPKSDFLRIHRSYLISIDKIDSFNKEIIEINGKELPIGRTYKNNTLNILSHPKQN